LYRHGRKEEGNYRNEDAHLNVLHFETFQFACKLNIELKSFKKTKA